MKVLCISASNILHSEENSISQILSFKISEILSEIVVKEVYPKGTPYATPFGQAIKVYQ